MKLVDWVVAVAVQPAPMHDLEYQWWAREHDGWEWRVHRVDGPKAAT